MLVVSHQGSHHYQHPTLPCSQLFILWRSRLSFYTTKSPASEDTLCPLSSRGRPWFRPCPTTRSPAALSLRASFRGHLPGHPARRRRLAQQPGSGTARGCQGHPGCPQHTPAPLPTRDEAGTAEELPVWGPRFLASGLGSLLVTARPDSRDSARRSPHLPPGPPGTRLRRCPPLQALPPAASAPHEAASSRHPAPCPGGAPGTRLSPRGQRSAAQRDVPPPEPRRARPGRAAARGAPPSGAAGSPP